MTWKHYFMLWGCCVMVASSLHSQFYCSSLPNHRQWSSLKLSVQLFRGECSAITDWLVMGEIISLLSLHGRWREPGADDEMYKFDELRVQSKGPYRRKDRQYVLANQGHGGTRAWIMVEGAWPEAQTEFPWVRRQSLWKGRKFLDSVADTVFPL